MEQGICGLERELRRVLARHARVGFILLAVLVSRASPAADQNNSTNSLAATNTSPTDLEHDARTNWSFSVTVNGYIVPESRDYVQPTLTADYNRLHLEARYNYDDLETGSAWVGCNFSGGGKLTWEFTPMLGGIFGNTTGIAPGYRGTLGFWKLELFSEAEFVIDPGNSDNNYFYAWSELSLQPVDWLRFGLVIQRTRAYESDRDVQRGFFIGVMFKHVQLTTYVLNPDESKPTFVLGTGFEW